MNLVMALQILMGAVVFVAIVARLAKLEQAGESVRRRLSWNVWVAAHVLVALGALCLALNLRGHALALTFTGLALYFGIRWQRRSSDR